MKLSTLTLNDLQILTDNGIDIPGFVKENYTDDIKHDIAKRIFDEFCENKWLRGLFDYNISEAKIISDSALSSNEVFDAIIGKMIVGMEFEPEILISVFDNVIGSKYQQKIDDIKERSGNTDDIDLSDESLGFATHNGDFDGDDSEEDYDEFSDENTIADEDIDKIWETCNSLNSLNILQQKISVMLDDYDIPEGGFGNDYPLEFSFTEYDFSVMLQEAEAVLLSFTPINKAYTYTPSYATLTNETEIMNEFYLTVNQFLTVMSFMDLNDDIINFDKGDINYYGDEIAEAHGSAAFASAIENNVNKLNFSEFGTIPEVRSTEIDKEATIEKADGDVVINVILVDDTVLTYYVNQDVQYIEESGVDVFDKWRGIYDDKVLELYNNNGGMDHTLLDDEETETDTNNVIELNPFLIKLKELWFKMNGENFSETYYKLWEKLLLVGDNIDTIDLVELWDNMYGNSFEDIYNDVLTELKKFDNLEAVNVPTEFPGLTMADINKISASEIRNYGLIGALLNLGYDNYSRSDDRDALEDLLVKGLDTSKYSNLENIYGNGKSKTVPLALLKQFYNIAKFHNPNLEWVRKYEYVVKQPKAAPQVKIKYTAIEKTTYDTDQTGIEFTVEINGKKATGFWQKKFSYNPDGMDIDSLSISQYGRITIFNGGGTQRSFEITSSPVLRAKQPKDLRFTGKYYDTAPMGIDFVNKIREGLAGPTARTGATLTPEFLKYFNLEIL